MKMHNLALTIFFSVLFSFPVFGQTDYQAAWEALNNADVEKAIDHFEKATKDKSTKESALLCLTILYSHRNKEPLASKKFKEFMKNSNDPYPEIYSLWFEDGVTGYNGKKYSYQFDLLKKLANDKENKGKLDAAANYRLLSHYTMSNDKKNMKKSFEKINHIEDWALVGPFDNVMNSGYDKDFGALTKIKESDQFDSKYGATVNWFDPPVSSNDGYLFKDLFFRSSNSIIYGQTFIESPKTQEVFLKFGYSGSLKVWVNDQLIYQDQEHRETEMDYFRYKLTLNKGYNRVLVQLGDYQESNANFTVRFTDLAHQPLDYATKTTAQPYQKNVGKVTKIPYFAIEQLKNKAKSDDPIYQVILAKAYMRSNELDAAEAILKPMVTKYPDNYFALRILNNLYRKSGNTTSQNKYYESFKQLYKHDKYILENEIKEARDKNEKERTRELIKIYLSKYEDGFTKLSYSLILESLDENNQAVLRIIDKLYDKFPENSIALFAKYNILKSYYSAPDKAVKVLEKYLKKNYNTDVISELANVYFEKGKADKALNLLRKDLELVPYSFASQRSVINILSRQSSYDKAIKECNKVLASKPSDYLILQDLALLHTYNNDKKKALQYYQQALEYFPFSFEINEKIRELQGKTKGMKLVPEKSPNDLIKDFEKNYQPKIKQAYDIVSESMSTIIYQSKAKAMVHKYIIRLNDETAIEQWQKLDFGSSSGFMSLYFDEVKTIKKNGQKIDADRNGGEVVFTNLEIGDYIYVSYYEKQVNGGKSAFFISDKFRLNSYSNSYLTEYNLFVEGDMKINYDMLNTDLKPVMTEVDGFRKYRWSNVAPEVMKEESYSIAFQDIAPYLHFSLDYSWKDIVEWYSDLSTIQATPDFTIKNLVSELFDGKNYSPEEKAKVLYEFVCKNIQYSFVDFRQSGFIPQKASSIYHARLGDCKDVSTLYVALARATGLDANLVLINTRDRGQKDVYLPSLDFNHCIVKVYLPDGPKFLELTDPDLPYGQLYYYHQGAAILEIPTKNVGENIQLDYLNLNKDFKSQVSRNSEVLITPDSKIEVGKKVIKTGTAAAGIVRSYYYSDQEVQKDDMKKSISSDFKSTVSLKELDFDLLTPRRDSVKYFYKYIVENDILKLGSLRTFKLPFSDKLINMNIFEDEERKYDFNFIYYENTDRYHEKMIVKLGENSSFKEMPQDIHAEFKGCVYDLKFKKLNDRELEVDRTYQVVRENIQPKDFAAFKKFMVQVNEGENTHLLYQ